MQILVADDSKTNLNLISRSLQQLGHEVVPAQSAQQAIELFKLSRPDLIILDVVMEGMDGFECAKQIRALNAEDWIPIIFLSASVDDESISKGIDAGGDDYLTKPFSEIKLAAKIKAMQRISSMRQELFQATQKLAQLSSTDSLTGIYNRLQFSKTIQEKIYEANRLGSNFALLFLDLDRFKSINDTLGHHVGDLLLMEVAKRLKSCLRLNDFVARVGGDEFAIILSHIEDDAVPSMVSQKIIDLLAQPFYLDGHSINCSSSIGIVCYPEDGNNQEELSINADIAMYHSKNTGRNRFQFYKKIPHYLRKVSSKDPIDIKTETRVKEPKISLLNCLVEDSQFCIELSYIQKNIPLVQFEPLPDSPHYVLGLINLAGHSIPVMDLGSRLNLGRKKNYTLSTPILLCSDGVSQKGFVVDEILGLYEVEQEALQTQDYQGTPDASILASLSLGSKLSLLVNMKHLLAVNDYN